MKFIKLIYITVIATNFSWLNLDTTEKDNAFPKNIHLHETTVTWNIYIKIFTIQLN